MKIFIFIIKTINPNRNLFYQVYEKEFLNYELDRFKIFLNQIKKSLSLVGALNLEYKEIKKQKKEEVLKLSKEIPTLYKEIFVNESNNLIDKHIKYTYSN